MKRGRTEAETLHLNGWGVGDIIEEYNPKKPLLGTNKILITRIGEERVLCRWVGKNGKEWTRESLITFLLHKGWRKIGEDTNLKRQSGFWGKVASNMMNKIRKLEEAT